MVNNNEHDITLAEKYNQQGKVLYSLNKYEETINLYLKAESAEPILFRHI